jgi:hypothetical protein
LRIYGRRNVSWIHCYIKIRVRVLGKPCSNERRFVVGIWTSPCAMDRDPPPDFRSCVGHRITPSSAWYRIVGRMFTRATGRLGGQHRAAGPFRQFRRECLRTEGGPIGKEVVARASPEGCSLGGSDDNTITHHQVCPPATALASIAQRTDILPRPSKAASGAPGSP